MASAMRRQGLVPLFYHSDASVARAIVQACYDGGSRVIEFLNRGDGAHKVFDAIRCFVSESLPEMMIGAGSVMDACTAALFMQLGADFIVAPVLNPEVARACNRRKLLWISGCSTLSEISAAEELGADIVKIFPGGILGPEFVRAIKAPCPWVAPMPTGGVDISRENLSNWFESGVACVGIGSRLISRDLVDAGDYGEISRRVEETLVLIREIRGAE